ncbi:MAG: hypothetical protein OEV06_12360 [Anaerolineae bacterium]|nr:hypothetical protein [Anaerolineae bacterium]
MYGFRLSKLEDGENVIFGPHMATSETKMSVHRPDDPGTATHTKYRVVCVTNQRVVIESGDSVLNVPTRDIQLVTIKRRPGKKGPSVFDLLWVKSKNGRRIELDIINQDVSRRAELESAFPNAEIKESKGLSGFLDKILGD